MPSRSHRTRTNSLTEADAQFQWLIAPLDELAAKPQQLFSSPATVAARVGTKVAENLAKRRQGTDDMAFWAELLSVIPDEAWTNGRRLADEQRLAARRRARATPAGGAALAVVDAAHEAIPFSPLFVMPDPVRRGTILLDTLGALRDAKRRRGEPRVRRLSEVTARVADPLHREHVERLWKLGQYAQGRAPGCPPNFGVVVRQIAFPMKIQSALVAFDASRIRNAIAHGATEYQPAARVMHFDRGSDRACTMSGRDLEKLVERMLRYDDALYLVLAEFAQWSVIAHVAPTIGRLAIALRNRDEKALTSLGIEYQAQIAAMLEPCGTLHRSLAQTRARSLAN